MRISDWSSDVCSSDLQVAARFGKTERFVLGRMRLADLAEPVFEALRKGEITLEVAKAYASTSDTARQTRVRSEERRGGKAWVSTCRSGGSPYPEKKQKKT